jgi:hypothetical protein
MSALAFSMRDVLEGNAALAFSINAATAARQAGFMEAVGFPSVSGTT